MPKRLGYNYSSLEGSDRAIEAQKAKDTDIGAFCAQDTVNLKEGMSSCHTQVTRPYSIMLAIVVDIDIPHWDLYFSN